MFRRLPPPPGGLLRPSRPAHCARRCSGEGETRRTSGMWCSVNFHKNPVRGSYAPIIEQIAKTYGLDSFGEVDAIRYTFNLDLSGKNISRAWVWEPKTGRVSFEGKDKDGKPLKVTYLQSELYTESDAVKDEVDPCFRQRQLLAHLPFPCLLGLARRGGTGQGDAEIAVREGLGEAGVGEVLVEGRLHARRYMGPVRRGRQPDRGIRLPSWRREEAAGREHDVGGLQEGRPAPFLDGPSRYGGWRARASVLLERSRQAGVGSESWIDAQ